ncbi:Cholesterol esterase [Streptomyces hygroscopicus subsp. limoneus]|nr:Cholesterol esterase [Streptomyces hygroscopicus subsp. limoneus]
MASSPDVPSTGNTPDIPGSDTPGSDTPPEARNAAGTTAGVRCGRVRARRAAVMAVPATLVAAGLAVLTAQGALGVQFAISGMPFTVTATELNGTGFEQFGGLDNMAEGSPNAGDTGGQVLVITSAIKHATLTKLCQSVDLGGTNLLITAGGGSEKVSATDLTTDSTELSGDAAFNNIEIGNDASTLTKAGVKGPIGVFSQQADTVRIAHLRQTNYATTAGVFKLPGLKLRFSDSGC